MVDVIETEPETAPVETQTQLPADTAPAPSNTADGELDDLLREFDEKTRQAESEPQQSPASESGAVSDEELNSFLSGLDSERNRISELEGEVGSLRAAELERKSVADFAGFSKQLQEKCGPNVPSDYARTQLLAMAAEKPELYAAWYYRHLTDAERSAADAEFRQLEQLYGQVQRSPDNDPRKQTALRQIEQRGQQLGYMLNARTMLNQAWRDIEKRAKGVAPPIDPEATADRDAVAFAVRENITGTIPEPPVNFGRMTDKEFKEYTRIHYGF